MIKRVYLALCLICLILSAGSLYASNEDYAVFRIGDSYIEIRWGMTIDDFDDKGNLYDFLSLVASNYDLIHSQKRSIVFDYFKEGDKYSLSYSIDNKEEVEISAKKFSKTKETVKEVLIKNFDLKDTIPETTNLLLVGILSPGGYKTPVYNELSEFYVGPAPGIMQAMENKKLYYLYFFFKEENVCKLIKQFNQEKSFSRAILIKRVMNRNNMERIFSLK